MREVQRQRRHAPADAVQERGRARADFRRDAHRFQRVRRSALRKPNSTTPSIAASHSAWRNSAPISCAAPGAVELRHRRRQRHQRAHRHHHRQPEQRGADRHRRQRGGAVVAGDARCRRNRSGRWTTWPATSGAASMAVVRTSLAKRGRACRVDSMSMGKPEAPYNEVPSRRGEDLAVRNAAIRSRLTVISRGRGINNSGAPG